MSGHRHRVEDTMAMQSVGDASGVGNAWFCASYFSKTAEIRFFGISKTAEIRIFSKIICLIH